jgi:nicotinate-nucleotide--dimethylbenzimidazole phosphoribosyltransferase
MFLGEGSGAVAVLPLLEMGLQVYLQMSTFEETGIEKYEVLK